MPVIPIAEAIERVAAAVETATADDVREVYGELYPRLPLPPGGPVAADLARHIRTAIHPEHMVDLWNVMFPAGQYVTYDDEAGVLRCSDHEESRYANHD